MDTWALKEAAKEVVLVGLGVSNMVEGEQNLIGEIERKEDFGESGNKNDSNEGCELRNKQ